MVAAGGGGAIYEYCSDGDYENVTGGAAGGLEGYSPIYIERLGYSQSQPMPGTQTSGGLGLADWTSIVYTSNYVGGFGYGGTGANSYGGGGAGYYGGASGVWHGGAGGSSYISGHYGVNSVYLYGTKINHNNSINHESGYVFKDTLMIDGKGYNWTGLTAGQYVGTPDITSTLRGTGNNSDGYARITPVLVISENDYLRSLVPSVGTLDKEFNPEEQSYTINVDANTKSIRFTGEVYDSLSTVTGLDEDIALNVGENTINVVVTAQSGDARTYVITVNRDNLEGTNVLDKIYVNDKVIEVVDNVYTYNVVIPYESINAIVTATKYDENTTYVVEGNEPLITDTGVIKVTSSLEGNEDIVYTINYTKERASLDEVTKSYVFKYTNNYQTFTAPITADYKFELWGASGGDAWEVDGGNGAYTTGIMHMNMGETVYVYVGGSGTSNNGITIKTGTYPGGWNGGANGYVSRTDCYSQGGGGGGATDIRLVNTATASTWYEIESLRSRVMVAAGGAGAYIDRCSNIFSHGGNGGALVGESGYYAAPRGGSYNDYNPTGGTQTNGGQGMNTYTDTSYTSNFAGSFGYGASGRWTNYTYSGGGAGYYGGASGGWKVGAGGSSYISGYLGSVGVMSQKHTTPKYGCENGTNDITCSYHYSGTIFNETNMLAGSQEMPTHDGKSTMVGNDGNGYAKITPLVVSQNNYLESLTSDVGVWDKSFNTTTYEYEITVERYVRNIEFTASTYSDRATITGATSYSLEVGNNPVVVNVTAENGEVRTYTINVVRKDIIESSTELKKIEFVGDNETRTTYMEENVYEYNITVGYTDTSLTVIPYAFDSDCTYEITGNVLMPDYTGTITVVVNNENAESSTYVFNYTREVKTAGFTNITDFDYTGDYQTFTAPASGMYKLETWGAQGGTGYLYYNGHGGYGAYATGYVYLEQGETIYVIVGGMGGGSTSTSANYAGGYNGGGYSWHWIDNNVYSGAGGGATHIATTGDLLKDLSDKRDTILVVAAGGGGSTYWNNTYTLGGDGGGIKGNDGKQVAHGDGYAGMGGTQTEGGTTVRGGTNYDRAIPYDGGFGYGGNSSKTTAPKSGGGAGGGAGWYGGAGADVQPGAGGGSSYIGSTNLLSFDSENFKHMTCYECETSEDENTYTISTDKASEEAISDYAKKRNGFARITSDVMSHNTYLKSITYRYDSLVDKGNGTSISEDFAIENFETATYEYSINVPYNSIYFEIIRYI